MKFSLLGIEVEVHKRDKRPRWERMPRVQRDIYAILTTVATYYGYTPEQLASKSRDQDLVKARRVFSYLSKLSGNTLKNIGLVINRDHSTITGHCETVRDEIDSGKFYYDGKLATEIREIMELLA